MDAALEREYLRTTALIKAAEDWSHEYAKDPKSHAQLIKLETKWQLILTKFFKELADKSSQFINLGAYYSQITADYNIDVIVNNVPFDQADGTFIKLSLEVVAMLTATGAQAGERIYDIPLGISSTDANIQKLSTDHVARLVGKRVLKDGSIVDAKNPEYNITETMRNDIVQSIKTSLALGENVDAATERLRKVIADPKRAERIARTESVNAYQNGLSQFALDSGAVGKEWLDVGAVDVCAEYADMGPVPIDFLYGGELDGPTAHPNCRCGRRLIYPQEWNSLQS